MLVGNSFTMYVDTITRPSDKGMFFFLSQNINLLCCGYSKRTVSMTGFARSGKSQ